MQASCPDEHSFPLPPRRLREVRVYEHRYLLSGRDAKQAARRVLRKLSAGGSHCPRFYRPTASIRIYLPARVPPDCDARSDAPPSGRCTDASMHAVYAVLRVGVPRQEDTHRKHRRGEIRVVVFLPFPFSREPSARGDSWEDTRRREKEKKKRNTEFGWGRVAKRRNIVLFMDPSP